MAIRFFERLCLGFAVFLGVVACGGTVTGHGADPDRADAGVGGGGGFHGSNGGAFGLGGTIGSAGGKTAVIGPCTGAGACEAALPVETTCPFLPDNGTPCNYVGPDCNQYIFDGGHCVEPDLIASCVNHLWAIRLIHDGACTCPRAMRTLGDSCYFPGSTCQFESCGNGQHARATCGVNGWIPTACESGDGGDIRDGGSNDGD